MRHITLLLLFITGIAYGQVTTEKEAFLMGTLDDYMGRNQMFTAKADSFYYQMVDIYFQSEYKLALFIDSLFKEEANDLCIRNNGAPKGIKLYSEELSGRINEYFSYTPTNQTIGYGKDTLYIGLIKKDRFTTESQKLAFLAGIYLRYKVPISNKIEKERFEHSFNKKAEPDIYWISIANSRSKAKICKDLLIEEGCSKVEYIIKSNYIPVGHHILFKPSEKVRKVIEEMDKIRNSIYKEEK